MQWYKNLYVSPRLKKRKINYINRIENSRRLRGIYIIAVSDIPGNQLEIMDARNLIFPVKKEHISMIVGLARSYFEAMELLEQMIEDAQRADMKGRIREYLLSVQSKINNNEGYI